MELNIRLQFYRLRYAQCINCPISNYLDAFTKFYYISRIASLYERFGKSKDDWGLVAEVDGKIVGAVWVRIMNDYGHIDDKCPLWQSSFIKNTGVLALEQL